MACCRTCTSSTSSPHLRCSFHNTTGKNKTTAVLVLLTAHLHQQYYVPSLRALLLKLLRNNKRI